MRRIRITVGLLTIALTALTATAASAAVKRWGGYGGRSALVEKVATTVSFPAAAGTIIKVDAGNAASYALSNNGTLWAFGLNEDGELGNGTRTRSMAPVQVKFPVGTDIVAIGEGRSSGYAVDSTGQGWAWGREAAQVKAKKMREGLAQALCLGARKDDVLTPEKVPGMTNATAVQGGGTHAVWLLDNGTVETCGANNEGQLGVETPEGRPALTPVVVPGVSEVLEISAGKATTCIRNAKGEIYDWGADTFGQIGDGEETEEGEEGEPEGEGEGVLTPFHVPLPGPASEISCGGNRSNDGAAMALVEGHAYGWGDDEEGELGDGDTTNKSVPVLASTAVGLNLTQVIASGSYSLGLTSAGEVYGWGSNSGFTLAAPIKEVAFSLKPRLIDQHVAEISATSFDSVDR